MSVPVVLDLAVGTPGLGKTATACMVAALRLVARGEGLTVRSIMVEAGYRSTGSVGRAINRLLESGLLVQEPGRRGTLRTNVAVVIPRREAV